MGLGKSFKKSLGKVAAVANPVGAFSSLAPIVAGMATGKAIGGAFQPRSVSVPGVGGGEEELYRLAAEEEAKRKALGVQQQGQINTFADETQNRANAFRSTLAKSLSDTSQGTFQRANPFILEDLNSRGLFTSQTARDQEQGRFLGDLAREEQTQLSNFDKDIFGQINDIRGTGLSALLGGDQSALDSALSLKKAGIQRSFDDADLYREQSFAAQLAKKQSKDQLLQSLLGLGGTLGAARLGRS